MDDTNWLEVDMIKLWYEKDDDVKGTETWDTTSWIRMGWGQEVDKVDWLALPSAKMTFGICQEQM